MRLSPELRFFSLLAFIPFLYGCGPKGAETLGVSNNAAYCQPNFPTSPVTENSGLGNVFEVDPMVASGNTALSPASATFGNFSTGVTLPRLLGYGTLRGNYVKVITDRCSTDTEATTYGAFSTANDFQYPHGDERFAEVMNYYHGDRFRSELAAASSLYPPAAFFLIANCDVRNNAYYSPPWGNQPPFVCMGYSSTFKSTTNFSDDSEVITHEMQHGVTGYAYSQSEDFNKLEYDEAGAINEGISDFVALMQADPGVSLPFFNHQFSRWALGQFFGVELMRGAAKCPVWTADYPVCSSYSAGMSGFSANAKRVSFSYPDGLGWPYAGPGKHVSLRSVWRTSSGFEEIHQTAPIITGALFDVYEGLVPSSLSRTDAKRRMIRFLMETVKALPKGAIDVSPVTMPLLAKSLVSVANSGTAGPLSLAEKTMMEAKFSARGLLNMPTIANGWAEKGPAVPNIPNTPANEVSGIFFYETKLSVNHRVQAGDNGAIWFNIRNNDANTAAAPRLRVTISNPLVRFSAASLNPGFQSPTEAYVRYGKINGTQIVAKMNDSADPILNTGMDNTYLSPLVNAEGIPLGLNIETALYIEVDPSITAGTVVNFTVEIESANEPLSTSTVIFPVKIQ